MDRRTASWMIYGLAALLGVASCYLACVAVIKYTEGSRELSRQADVRLQLMKARIAIVMQTNPDSELRKEQEIAEKAASDAFYDAQKKLLKSDYDGYIDATKREAENKQKVQRILAQRTFNSQRELESSKEDNRLFRENLKFILDTTERLSSERRNRFVGAAVLFLLGCAAAVGGRATSKRDRVAATSVRGTVGAGSPEPPTGGNSSEVSSSSLPIAQSGPAVARNPAADIPTLATAWNWGAFWLVWIWGIGNRTWIALLALIPGVNFVMMFILGARGNAWAWKNRQWDNVEHFQRVQKTWAVWGFVVAGVGVVVVILEALG